MAHIPRMTFHLWRWLIPFFVGLGLIGAISFAAWFVLGGGIMRQPQRIEFVIPFGAAQRVQAGEAVPSIPARSVFVAGDELVLRNEDVANHQMGPFWIPAATTVTVPLDRPSTFNYLCTIHPSGYIGLEVRPRNSLWQALVPTLLLGVPIGIVLSIIMRVMAHLETV